MTTQPSVDILLMVPPSPLAPRNDGRLFKPAVGLAYLRAALTNKGFSCDILVHDGFPSTADFIRYLETRNVKILGMSCYEHNLAMAASMAKVVKARCPLTIVLGGPSVTFSPETVARVVPHADYLIRGDGEHALAALCNKLLGTTPETPVGLRPWILQEELVPNLDDYPSPYLVDRSFLSYWQNDFPLLTSRGCHYGCAYCSLSFLSRGKVRFHSLPRVYAEIDAILGAVSAPVIRFLDDTFTANLPRAKKILRHIISRQQPVTLDCQCRIDTIDEEFLDLYVAAGGTQLNFGLESADPEVLKLSGKARLFRQKSTPGIAFEESFLQRFTSVVPLAQSKGLKVFLNIIIGMPGETPVKAMGTLDFIRKLNPDGYIVNHLKIHPGTPFYDMAPDYGLSIIHEDTLAGTYATRLTFDPDALNYPPRRLNWVHQRHTLFTRLVLDGAVADPSGAYLIYARNEAALRGLVIGEAMPTALFRSLLVIHPEEVDAMSILLRTPASMAGIDCFAYQHILTLEEYFRSEGRQIGPFILLDQSETAAIETDFSIPLPTTLQISPFIFLPPTMLDDIVEISHTAAKPAKGLRKFLKALSVFTLNTRVMQHIGSQTFALKVEKGAWSLHGTDCQLMLSDSEGTIIVRS